MRLVEFDFESLNEGTLKGLWQRVVVVNEILMGYSYDDKAFHIGVLVDA